MGLHETIIGKAKDPCQIILWAKNSEHLPMPWVIFTHGVGNIYPRPPLFHKAVTGIARIL